ncbi:hypothetical protein KK137_12745 [Croceibacterium sp. LX-88]|uniref:TonB C-terminal domain-containing protein n=1 Tax=Croceibacterium selenioxidans TaxID=2838833 RepID=A0ABS5W621_9SPHN|nr:hypothetical protein [Croceibacterium selenioxidans]MBT2135197.1 hypothetical protein [Croceibacterium selenioxidans]
MVIAAGALCLLQAGVAHAQSALQLAPAEEWELGSGPESCWISRRFGAGDKGLFVRIETFGTRSSLRVFMRGKPLPQRDSGILDFQTQYNPNGTANERAGILNWSGNAPTLTFLEALTPMEGAGSTADPQGQTYSGLERTTRELKLTFSRGSPVSLQLGSMEASLDRLQECAHGLPAKWGFDADQQRALIQAATPIDGDRWIDPGSFPWEYLRSYQSVVLNLRLLVDDGGMPTDCIVQAPQFERAASEIACRTMMANARFEPALDAEGEPVASYYTTSIFYRTKRRNGNS